MNCDVGAIKLLLMHLDEVSWWSQDGPGACPSLRQSGEVTI